MPKVKKAVRVEELARIIMSLTPGELETFVILMDKKEGKELLIRKEMARKEKEEGKLLTLDELFS